MALTALESPVLQLMAACSQCRSMKEVLFARCPRVRLQLNVMAWTQALDWLVSRTENQKECLVADQAETAGWTGLSETVAATMLLEACQKIETYLHLEVIV